MVIFIPILLMHLLSFSMVSTYLIHHGYFSTAEAFSHITEEPLNEDLTSIKNRQSKYLYLSYYFLMSWFFSCRNIEVGLSGSDG